MPWLPALGGVTAALLVLSLPVVFVAKLPLPYQVKRWQVTLGTGALLLCAILYGWMFGEPIAPALWLLMGVLLVGGMAPIAIADKSARQDGLSIAQLSSSLLPVLGIVLFVMVLTIFGRAIAHV